MVAADRDDDSYARAKAHFDSRRLLGTFATTNRLDLPIEERGVSVKFFSDFIERFKIEPDATCDVVRHLVRMLTTCIGFKGCSLVELCATEVDGGTKEKVYDVGKATCFVSQTGSHTFAEECKLLQDYEEKWKAKNRGDLYVFYPIFAIDQQSLALGEDLEAGSRRHVTDVLHAIQEAKTTAVLLNSSGDIAKSIWCLTEVAKTIANECRLDVCFDSDALFAQLRDAGEHTDKLRHVRAIDCINSRTARAKRPADAVCLRVDMCKDHSGFQQMDDFLKRELLSALAMAVVAAVEAEKSFLEDAPLLVGVGSLLSTAGKYDDSLKYLNVANLVSQNQGNGLAQGRAQHCMGNVYRKKQDFANGKKLLAAALASFQAAGGRVESVPTLKALGVCAGVLGEHAAALEHLNAALEVVTETAPRGANDVACADVLNNVGLCLARTGELSEARGAYERALAILERDYGADAAQTAGTVVNMGSLAYKRGRMAEAAALFERALRVQEAARGEAHASLGNTLLNLGSVWNAQERCDDALACYRRALAILETAHGPASIGSISISMSIGTLYRKQNELEKALGELQGAMEVAEKFYGKDSGKCAPIVLNMGVVQFDKGELDQAAQSFERALQLQESTYGSECVQSASTIMNLGALYNKQGQGAKALEFYERALRVQERAYGEDQEGGGGARKKEANHPALGLTCYNLALLTGADKGQEAEAASLMGRAVRCYTRAFGEEHPKTLAAKQNEAWFLSRIKDDD